ncbi:MAG TPA: hypothetical protein VG826_22170 [Pirellulales bacterium]|nr:hypothetical protein [Pirellulales bacterium]
MATLCQYHQPRRVAAPANRFDASLFVQIASRNVQELHHVDVTGEDGNTIGD